MKKIAILLLLLNNLSNILFAQITDFNSENYTSQSLEMPDGKIVKYKAYENLCYVSNVTDSLAQRLNIYVPENLDKQSPIVLKTYCTNFRSSIPQRPSSEDITGHALAEGMIICIPGNRGSNSFYLKDVYEQKKKNKRRYVGTEAVYCGAFPASLIDLKAAVRYLRANCEKFGGDAEKIIATGFSAGGTLSALLGISADSNEFNSLVDSVSSLKVSDKVWAVVSFSPITEIKNYTMAENWIFDHNDSYSSYIDSLTMLIPETEEPLLSYNYNNYLKDWLLMSVSNANACGIEIPDSVGAVYYVDNNGYDDLSEYLVDFNIPMYLNYVYAVKSNNKNFTSFRDSVLGDRNSPDYNQRAELIELMRYLSDSNKISQHWYIRHGAKDASVPFTSSLNFATRLMNMGCNVNFFMPWAVAYRGDYGLDELMQWINTINN